MSTYSKPRHSTSGPNNRPFFHRLASVASVHSDAGSQLNFFSGHNNSSGSLNSAQGAASSSVASNKASYSGYKHSSHAHDASHQSHHAVGAADSHETISLSRSLTASSVTSSSTVNTTFETKWMPGSDVVKPETYRISLRLHPREIDLLRWSWDAVTSNEAKPLDPALNQVSVAASIKSRGSGTLNTADFSSYLFCVQFYNNLMSMDGTIEEMIPSIKHQASSFAGIINYAIQSLEDLTKMNETLMNLGKLHSRILGIDPPYFRTMGNALILTFKDWFGNDEHVFSLEMEEAWIKLYCFLANSIIQGGADPMIEYDDGQESLGTSDSYSTTAASSAASLAGQHVRPEHIQSTGYTNEQAAAAVANARKQYAPQQHSRLQQEQSAPAQARAPQTQGPTSSMMDNGQARMQAQAQAQARAQSQAQAQALTQNQSQHQEKVSDASAAADKKSKGKRRLRGKGKDEDCIIM